MNRHIKLYESFNLKLEDVIEGTWEEKDGLINVNGSVYLDNKNLTKIPWNFGTVTGDFWCDNNQLTTLEGCPKKIGFNFYCYHNKLTTLKYYPKEVVGYFYCHNNPDLDIYNIPFDYVEDPKEKTIPLNDYEKKKLKEITDGTIINKLILINKYEDDYYSIRFYLDFNRKFIDQFGNLLKLLKIIKSLI